MSIGVIAVALALGLVGVGFAAVGLAGLRGALSRNAYFGVRTQSSMRSDETFRLANRVAGLPVTVGGAVGALSAAALLIMQSTGGVIVTAVIGVLGMLGIVGAGGVLGHRAAATLPDPEPASPGCGGCCGGICAKTALGGR